jgi:Amt family ammonium transporter
MMPVLITTGATAIVLPILTQIAGRTDLPASAVGIAATMGGAAALVGAILAGPRKGKFNRDLSVNFVPGHNILLQLVGVMILVIALAGISNRAGATLVAGSSALLAAAAVGRMKFGKIDTGLMIAGAVGGLIAGATSAGPTWVAFLVGAAVGVAVPFAVMVLEVRFRIDDVTAAVPTHWLGGFVGMIAAVIVQLALIAFTDQATWTWWVLMWACMPIVSSIFGAATAFASFYICKSMNQVRISESAEFDGTDLSELDVNAYPDFQQTMIKSYHLREL